MKFKHPLLGLLAAPFLGLAFVLYLPVLGYVMVLNEATRRVLRIVVGATAAMLLVSTVASAQTVVNPKFIEFVKSVDHDAVLPGTTTPVVTSYEARWFVQGAASPVAKITLGKPTPNVDGIVRLSLTAPDLLVGVPIDPKVTYVARVAAIGPEGEGESTDSNPFARLRVTPPSSIKLVK